MDEIKKWDLLQLPGYEAIDDGDGDGDGVESMIEPKDLDAKVKIKRKDYFKIIGSKYVHGDPEEIINTDLKNLAHYLIDFNYKYDTNKNMITVGKKPESIAQFKFEDLDEGLVNKEAKDILDEYGYRLQSNYVEKTIESIERKIKSVESNLFSIKSHFKNTVFFDHTEGLDLAIPKSGKPKPKTLDLIEKHDVLAIFSHGLKNLKMFLKKISNHKQDKVFYISAILFNFLTDLNYSVVRFWLEIME